MTLVAAGACPGAGVKVVEVAMSLWAVFDVSVDSAVAVGHIDYHGDRFFVGLEDGALEPYSFASLDHSVEWFVEFCFAIRLGSAEASGPATRVKRPARTTASGSSIRST
jgi:hypothetical protein